LVAALILSSVQHNINDAHLRYVCPDLAGTLCDNHGVVLVNVRICSVRIGAVRATALAIVMIRRTNVPQQTKSFSTHQLTYRAFFLMSAAARPFFFELNSDSTSAYGFSLAFPFRVSR
jgi:hypothetical protein